MPWSYRGDDLWTNVQCISLWGHCTQHRFDQSNPLTVGGTVTIIGTNFTSTGNSVTIGGVPASIISETPTQIVVTVPADVCPGAIVVTTCGQTSNSFPYGVTAPNIVSINPDPLTAGGTVTIFGTNFTSTGNSVTIGGVPASIISETPTQIVATVPADVCPGAIVVTTCGQTSNAFPYGVTAPNIVSISPDPLTAGGTVTIFGTNFTSTGNSVTIGGVPASILSETPTQIVATVPADVCPGAIVVTTACSQTSNAFPYGVTAPSIVSISPDPLTVGGTVTIFGTNFTSTGNSVTIGGFSAAITSESITEIQATVPNLNDACSAGVVVTTACSLVSNTINASAVETIPPTLNCPGAITINCEDSSLPANTGSATATDNCDTPVIGHTDVSTQTNNGTCTDYSYTITRTWTATDNSSNNTSCVQTITIVDNTAPVLVGTIPGQQWAMHKSMHRRPMKPRCQPVFR
ncbi:MAG: IPT/TIG domain-containing protein [Saprospirales bacterium]|nr:IPT/TIG domain-containing protein [Saprospirales bacterium]